MGFDSILITFMISGFIFSILRRLILYLFYKYIKLYMNIARNIRNLHQIHHSYIYASKYKFLTPIDKPIYSLALTSYHEFSAELMIFPYL